MTALADKEAIFDAYEEVRKDDSETNWQVDMIDLDFLFFLNVNTGIMTFDLQSHDFAGSIVFFSALNIKIKTRHIIFIYFLFLFQACFKLQ